MSNYFEKLWYSLIKYILYSMFLICNILIQLRCGNISLVDILLILMIWFVTNICIFNDDRLDRCRGKSGAVYYFLSLIACIEIPMAFLILASCDYNINKFITEISALLN